MNQMKIARANFEDVTELNRLVNSAYRGEESKTGWTTEAEILDGIRIDEQAVVMLLGKSGVTILKTSDVDGKILGTVCLEVKPNGLYLGMFAVSPDSQGLGIGKSLLSAADRFALENSCGSIIISVISTRIELIDWYKRQGFVSTGSSIAFDEIEGRFGDPKVADIRLIEMEKVLNK
ncbi:GNAT family N-acetyltransferase [Pedobacter duraquae]|uniref:Ribosomal protein S18 acetylase RimI-like enzyme n=1 Tax=Pedobacter duraquae TaxID=425511 RepID=A0A4R6IHQ9_9SPHI|nr:GNAT family N-acetyltransferase [Pedobacter duraquae]TDO20925.1 ribosomal protein S18 acetylase RimI-like enzyme [Pedobacter duraquae]